jgi:hypothetical protein
MPALAAYLKCEKSDIRARQETREEPWQGDDAPIAFISRVYQPIS